MTGAMSATDIKEKYIQYLPIGVLLLVYFLCRLFFQYTPDAKSIFIYPTGLIVEAFYGTGNYIQSEWIYFVGKTKFILGDTCSGTTFFSLLFSYLIYRALTVDVSWLWLIAAFPATLVANSMRVLSSIHAHNYLAVLELEQYGDSVHVIAGTSTFLTCFLIIAHFVEKGRSSNEKK